MNTGTITYNKSTIWFPHLILQRRLGVKDLRKVNFKATLLQPRFGENKAWEPVDSSVRHGGNKPDNGPYFDRGAREPSLTYGGEPREDEESGELVQDILPVRGEPVVFEYKGYSTFLFQEEFDLISQVLPNIQEITINTTDGLTPLFQILAVVKEDLIEIPEVIITQ